MKFGANKAFTASVGDAVEIQLGNSRYAGETLKGKVKKIVETEDHYGCKQYVFLDGGEIVDINYSRREGAINPSYSLIAPGDFDFDHIWEKSQFVEVKE